VLHNANEAARRAYPIDFTGGVKFSGCPPICACVRAYEDAFSDRLVAVDF